MPPLSKVAIVDTSCFILLDKINELKLLKNNFRFSEEVFLAIIKAAPEE